MSCYVVCADDLGPRPPGARHLLRRRRRRSPPWPWCCRSSPCVCSSRARVARYPATGKGRRHFEFWRLSLPSSGRGGAPLPADRGYLGAPRARPDVRGGAEGGTYHVGLAASFFILRICLVAHWLSCLVLVLLERRPCVRRSLMGSTSTMLSMCEPKAVSRSLRETKEE